MAVRLLRTNGLAALALVVTTLGAADFAMELGTDYGAYFSHGWFVTQGLVPYGDFWTHKTPFLPMLLALWIEVFGTSFYAAVAFPLVMTFATACILHAFALRLHQPASVAIGASLLFAFFSASHTLDASRNGVIVIAAAASEMLALILVIGGVRSDRRGYLAGAGLLVALAFATRQTAAVICLPVVTAVVLCRGRSQLKQAAVDVAILSAAAALGVAAFVAYFVLNGVSLATVWDQIYRFNMVYAAGHRMKLTWWGAGWGLLVWRSGLLILVGGVLWLAWGVVRTVQRREPLDFTTQILGVLAVAHLAVIYLSQKVQGMYLYQLMPELCVMTAMAGHAALRPAGKVRLGALRKAGVLAAGVVLLARPVAVEAAHWRTTVARAAVGGYLLNAANLPSQVLARRIQELATRETDQIWIFSASSDALYPFADRLPAVRMTSVAGLLYVMSPNDFERWRADFSSHLPRVVLSFYGEDFVRRWAGNPQRSNGQNYATILEIRQYLMTTMSRVDSDGQLPEVFVPLGRH